jgi:hypothetical protein
VVCDPFCFSTCVSVLTLLLTCDAAKTANSSERAKASFYRVEVDAIHSYRRFDRSFDVI